MQLQTIGELVTTRKQNYTSTPSQISEYVEYSQFDNVNKILAYLSQTHVSGKTDALGRDKPFFDIGTATANIWYRATDLDRKNIRIKAVKEEAMLFSHLATAKLQDWMRRENFGIFLNEWGRALSRFGSAIVKFVDTGDTLIPSVVAWDSVISDNICFEDDLQIERHQYTPSQLMQNEMYDKEVVKGLIENLQSRKDMRGTEIDKTVNFIEVFEVHGNLPKSYLTGNEEDDEIYVEQMHVISFVENKQSKKGYDEYTLYKGKANNPYLLTHLIREDNRAMGKGAIEYVFESQWMLNHSMKLIKDQLDFSSKIITQTSDESFVGKNILTDIETGDILFHTAGNPLTRVNNQAVDVTSLINFGTQWKSLAQEITSTPDAIRGNTQPAGTAYRLQQLITNESHSLFEQMIENKGLAIEEMMRKFILPFIKRKLNTKEEIIAALDEYTITQIDKAFLKNKPIQIANEELKKRTLLGEVTTPEQYQADISGALSAIQEKLSSQGNTRYIKPDEISEATWKEVFKDIEWDVEVEVTNEQGDKEAILTTLTTVFQTLANPNTQAVLQTPQGKHVFNKILETAGGISPVEMQMMNTPTSQPTAVAPAPANPLQGLNPTPTGGA